MKKIIIKITALLAVAAMCVSFCSCQLSDLLNKETDSGASESDTPPTDTDSVEKHEAMDLKNLDLTKYLKLGDYKGFKLSVASDKLTEEEFRASINEILESKAKGYEEIKDRKTKKGDKLNIDFEGYMDGKQFEGGTAKSQIIELSEVTGYISGFDADLYDVIPGTTVETRVTFPDPYPNDPTKAGKEATFKITINYIYGDPILPEYNDEFVSEYSNGKYKTVDAFEEYYRGYFQKHKKYEILEKKKTLAWDAFVKSCIAIEIPQQQIDYYYYQDRDYYESYAKMYGMTYESFLEYIQLSDSKFRENAYENALNDIALYSLIKAENITLSDEEYKTMLEEYADMNDVTAEYAESYLGKDLLMEYFEYDKARLYIVSLSEFSEEEESLGPETDSEPADTAS